MHEENTVTFTQCVHVHKSVRLLWENGTRFAWANRAGNVRVRRSFTHVTCYIVLFCLVYNSVCV